MIDSDSRRFFRAVVDAAQDALRAQARHALPRTALEQKSGRQYVFAERTGLQRFVGGVVGGPLLRFDAARLNQDAFAARRPR